MRRKGQHELRASFLAPLKIRGAAFCAEGVHFGVQRCASVNFPVVEWAIPVTITSNLPIAADMDIVTVRNVFSVGMEDFTKIFPYFDPPFWVDMGVPYPFTFIVMPLVSVVVTIVLVVVIMEFPLVHHCDN